MTEGYIYCLSNECMPGILKVGMTERTPDVRAKELFTTGVPTPFIVEFAKKVKDVKTKEKTLHDLLEQYTERVSPNREFFRVSLEEVRTFFKLMDGEPLIETPKEEVEDDEEVSEQETACVKPTEAKTSSFMAKHFTNGQRICHTIGITKKWIGIYDSSNDEIVCDGVSYASLSAFALSHRRIYKPERQSAGGPAECKCEVDGKWISIADLPR